MGFRVVDDIPLPDKFARAGRASFYNFGALGVGQALLFDADDKGFVTNTAGKRDHKARIAGHQWAKRNGKTFASRMLPDGRFGIWRIA